MDSTQDNAGGRAQVREQLLVKARVRLEALESRVRAGVFVTRAKLESARELVIYLQEKFE